MKGVVLHELGFTIRQHLGMDAAPAKLGLERPGSCLCFGEGRYSWAGSELTISPIFQATQCQYCIQFGSSGLKFVVPAYETSRRQK